MEQIIAHGAETVLYTGAFWLIYMLVWRNRPLHRGSRIYLLCAAAAPLIMPFVHWPGLQGIMPETYQEILPAFKVSPVPGTQHSERFGHAAALLYGVVAAGLLLRILVRYSMFSRFLGKHQFYEVKGVRIYINTGRGPGSFGKCMFFPDASVLPVILAHERAHILYGHRYDLLALKLLQCLFWPNIFLYAIGRELKMVHEFQADNAACGIEKIRYADALLGQVFEVPGLSFAHSFFHFPLRRRITMLQRQPVSRKGRIHVAVACFCLTAIFSTGALWAQQARHALLLKKVHSNKGKSSDTGIFRTAAKMPEFAGDLGQYLASHIVYPEGARRADKEGSVIIRFVVDASGNIRSPQVMRSSGVPELDQEGLRVIGGMPSWKPGRNKEGRGVSVYFSLPISFRLD